MSMVKQLESCFEEIGVYIIIPDNLETLSDSIDLVDEDDLDITEFISSSMQFIELVVCIEEKFEIELPDELLTIELFSSIKSLIRIIKDLKK